MSTTTGLVINTLVVEEKSLEHSIFKLVIVMLLASFCWEYKFGLELEWDR